MKKIIIFMMLLFLLLFYQGSVQANEYYTYQDITFEHEGAYLLEDYSNSHYKKYYKRIDKRRFWGWRTFVVIEHEPVSFIKDTLYIIKNEGTTPITEKFTFEEVRSVEKQYSVSGNLEISGSGKKAGIKLGLERELEFTVDVTTEKERTEEFEIKVHVDPDTRLIVQVCGEGKVSNGVGKYYRFFRNVKKGGWEIFVVTTQYYSLVKERINEPEAT